MNKFIIKTVIFLLPIILIWAVLELFVTLYPMNFNTKAWNLQNNLENIEVLFLGSSHIQCGINPEFISSKSVNLAYGGQDYLLNAALFFKHVHSLKNLRSVVLEVDYHSLERKNPKDYFRLPWYYRFYGVQPQKLYFMDKLSIYYSSPFFFNNYLISQFSPGTYKYKINEFGFVTNNIPGVFKDFDYDSTRLALTAPKRLRKRHRKVSMENYNFNTKLIDSIISQCGQNNIQVFLLTCPVFTSYRNNYLKEKNERRRQYLKTKQTHYPQVILLDFENDRVYNSSLFINDDHLNSNGAKVFSLTLDSALRSAPSSLEKQ